MPLLLHLLRKTGVGSMITQCTHRQMFYADTVRHASLPVTGKYGDRMTARHQLGGNRCHVALQTTEGKVTKQREGNIHDAHTCSRDRKSTRLNSSHVK